MKTQSRSEPKKHPVAKAIAARRFLKKHPGIRAVAAKSLSTRLSGYSDDFAKLKEGADSVRNDVSVLRDDFQTLREEAQKTVQSIMDNEFGKEAIHFSKKGLGWIKKNPEASAAVALLCAIGVGVFVKRNLV